MPKTKYNFPTNLATKTGKLKIDSPKWSTPIQFQETRRDEQLDSTQEIDIDFPFLETITIPIFRAKKESELFFTLNRN